MTFELSFYTIDFNHFFNWNNLIKCNIADRNWSSWKSIVVVLTQRYWDTWSGSEVSESELQISCFQCWIAVISKFQRQLQVTETKLHVYCLQSSLALQPNRLSGFICCKVEAMLFWRAFSASEVQCANQTMSGRRVSEKVPNVRVHLLARQYPWIVPAPVHLVVALSLSLNEQLMRWLMAFYGITRISITRSMNLSCNPASNVTLF